MPAGSQATELEKLIVRLVADATQYDKVLNHVERETGQTFKRIAALGTRLSVSLTLPLVAAGVKSLKLFAGFEEGIKRVGGAAGLSATEMKVMSKAAMDLSKNLGQSPEKMVGTFGALIRGGFTLQQVLDGAGESAAKLATVGEVDTDVAAETVVKILNVFKADGLSAAQAVDTLASAADASVISIGDMIQTLSQGGNTAASAGNSFKEFGAMAAMLGQAGIMGSDAGTSIKSFYSRLTDPKPRAKLEALVGSIADVKGNLLPIRDIMEKLNKQFASMPNAQKLGVLTKIFGTDASRAALVFATNGAKGFDEFTKKMEEARTVAEKYKMIQDSLSGQWEAFTAGLERVGITIGEILAPRFAQLVGYLNRAFEAFQGLSPGMQEFVVWTLAGVAAAGPMLLIIGKLVPGVIALVQGLTALKAVGVTSITAIFGAFRSGLAALMLMNPWLLALSAIVAGIVYLFYGSGGFGAAWDYVTEKASAFFNAVGLSSHGVHP